ncbi:MAG: pyridoxal phosphate-dependent aminotransferase [Candidatus Brockarchaeota archaeon]|nr:pyridoxal phosphate-dependent aminotransferase [Candidatus Brockarchaeota archaeon]
MKPFAKSMARIGTESAFEVLARCRELERQGKRILHFEIGEPDFPSPPHVVEAAKKALDQGFTHYTPPQGILELREAVCEEIERSRGFKPKPDQVIIGPGGKPIILFAMLATVEEGDEVIVQDPAYPMYASIANYAGAKVVPVRLREENDFRMTAEDVNEKVTRKTKMVVINSPQNPTGSVLSKEDVTGIAEIAEDNDLWLLSDEIYNRIIYGAEHFSPATRDAAAERTILVDGFSKAYAMTGYRLGYGVAPEKLVQKMVVLAINTISCVTTFVQLAGVAALKGPQDSTAKMVGEFRARRDLIVSGLNGVRGFKCANPKGAFYVFPNITRTGMGSAECGNYLLEKGGIAVLPGTAFGDAGEGYVRFSYATSRENIKEMIEKLKALF